MLSENPACNTIGAKIGGEKLKTLQPDQGMAQQNDVSRYW
jgi:hypothetical protein